jgi:hypothetical protein
LVLIIFGHSCGGPFISSQDNMPNLHEWGTGESSNYPGIWKRFRINVWSQITDNYLTGRYMTANCLGICRFPTFTRGYTPTLNVHDSMWFEHDSVLHHFPCHVCNWLTTIFPTYGLATAIQSCLSHSLLIWSNLIFCMGMDQTKYLYYTNTSSWQPNQSHTGRCNRYYGPTKTLVYVRDSISCCYEACMWAEWGIFKQFLSRNTQTCERLHYMNRHLC